jgi:hypothetical protein
MFFSQRNCHACVLSLRERILPPWEWWEIMNWLCIHIEIYSILWFLNTSKVTFALHKLHVFLACQVKNLSKTCLIVSCWFSFDRGSWKEKTVYSFNPNMILSYSLQEKLSFVTWLMIRLLVMEDICDYDFCDYKIMEVINVWWGP